MRRVLNVGEDTVTVQPGVIHGRLNRSLEVVRTILNRAARPYRDHDGRA